MPGFRELARSHNGLAHALKELSTHVHTLEQNGEKTRSMFAYFVRLGFLARLRWLLTGKVE